MIGLEKTLRPRPPAGGHTLELHSSGPGLPEEADLHAFGSFRGNGLTVAHGSIGQDRADWGRLRCARRAHRWQIAPWMAHPLSGTTVLRDRDHGQPFFQPLPTSGVHFAFDPTACFPGRGESTACIYLFPPGLIGAATTLGQG